MLKVARVTIKRLLKDPTMLISLFVVPIAIITAFALFTQPQPDTSVERFSVAIVGPVPEAYVSALKAGFTSSKVESVAKANRLVQEGRVAGAFVFKDDTLIQVKATSGFVGTRLLERLEKPLPSQKQERSQSEAELLAARKESRQGLINFLINYMLFSMIAIASDLTLLKETRVDRRHTAMPLSAVQLYSGHVLAFATLLSIQIMVVQVAARQILGIPLVDSLVAGTAVLMAMVLISLCLGLLAAGFCRQASHVPMVANAMLMPLMMVSSTFMNLDGLGWLSRLKHFTPQHWVSDALMLINSGQPYVLTHLMVLITIALFIFSLSLAGRRTLV